MNAALQMLLSNREVRLRIKLLTYDRRQYRLLSELVRSVCNLELVIDSKNRSKRNAKQWHVDQALRKVYSLFMKKNPSWVGRQQDPQEFITLLISYMDDDLKKYHLLMYGNISLVARKALASLFEIQFSVQLSCTRCGHAKPIFNERDQSLRLNVSDDDSPLQSVVSLIEKYLQNDEVVCVCEKCNRNTFFKQVRRISRYPENLSVVIGRCPKQSLFTGTLWKCQNLIQIEPVIGTFESECSDVEKLESKQDRSIELVAYDNFALAQYIAYKPLSTEDVNNIKVLLNSDDTTQFTDCDILDCHHCSRNPQETCLIKINEAPRTLSIEGDGNCLFRALSWWIYHGNDGYYTCLRKKIVGFIESHKVRFAELLPKNSSIDNHLRKMSMNRCWGTHVELSGAATFFCCSIFTFHKGKWAEYKPFFGKNVTSKNAIYIDNSKGNHFDVAIGQLPSAAENQRSLYSLRSVICHEGDTTDSGHCYCFRYDYFNRTWYKCSDKDIYKVDESLVLKESMQAGYILGYQKHISEDLLGCC